VRALVWLQGALSFFSAVVSGYRSAHFKRFRDHVARRKALKAKQSGGELKFCCCAFGFLPNEAKRFVLF